jgi:TnpA family transposase
MTIETTIIETPIDKDLSCDMQNAEDLSEEALAIDWTLAVQDLDFVYKHCHRGSENLLRLTIQLCVLRKTGRFVQDYHEVPIKAVQYLTYQLELEPVLVVSPPERNATEYNYRKLICEYLSFRDFAETTEISFLSKWVEHKVQLEALSQGELLEQSEKLLLSQKIILPSRKQLGRIIATLRNQAQQKVYDKINQKITPKLRQQIEQFLQPSKINVVSLQDLKRSPPEPSVKIIHKYLDRLKKLEAIDIPSLDLSDIHPNLIETFYRLTCTYNIRDLRRMMPSSKRYALLACFLSEAYKILLDHLVELNDKMLETKERESRNQFKKNATASRREAKIAEKILLATIKNMYHQEKTEDMMLSKFIATLNNDEINKAMAECEEYHQYEEEGVLRELQKRYPYLRKYTGRFFELDFKAAHGSENLLRAVNVLRQMNAGTLKSIPEKTPIDFVQNAWKNALHNPDGTLHQRTWELAVYYAVNKALGSGDLYLPDSNNHRNFWHTVYDEKTWKQEKDTEYSKLKLPTQFDEVFKKLKVEFEEKVKLAKKSLLDKDAFAYIEKGELKLHHDDALFIPESTKKLRQQIESRLPFIRIEKLLEDVDAMTDFSKNFVPQEGYVQKSQIPRQHLYAALLAHATNMGLYGMAHSLEGIALEELRLASRWLIYDDTLKAANIDLVNKHYELPISRIYGTGHRSGSDAKRYGIRASSLLASFYPRHFGYYDKAISIYTHISDIFSVFSTLVISCGVREALYVLTGLLNHDSQLNPEFHCTDTHGFTHHIFALCYLLGFSFQPRLKDLGSQQLFKLDKNFHYGEIDSLFVGAADVELVGEQWDNFVRIAASLKNRDNPAHLIVDKLACRTDTDRTAKALVELGKIIKTIFILQYISSSEFRHIIQLQLNRGEHRHNLAQHIFFADQGIFKTNDYEEIMNKASCLSFVSNAILYWNTVHISKIVDQLKVEGYPVNNEDLARISLLMFKHIIVTGIYRFSEIQIV